MKISDIINEAPIADYKTIGDFDKNSSFRHKQDRNLITKPSLIKKTYDKFASTGHEFNLLFVNSPAGNRHTEVGKVTPKWVRENLGDEVANELADSMEKHPEAINVIFTNNKGDARIAMTPWIMAHRIGHAMARIGIEHNGMRTDDYSYSNPYFRQAHRHLLSQLAAIMEVAYGMSERTTDGIQNALKLNSRDRSAELLIKHISHTIGTFKSARGGKIRDWFELNNELLAQYLTTGNIKFNPLPPTMKAGKFTFTSPDEDDLRYANQQLSELADDMENFYSDAMGAVASSVFVM